MKSEAQEKICKDLRNGGIRGTGRTKGADASNAKTRGKEWTQKRSGQEMKLTENRREYGIMVSGRMDKGKN